MSDITSLQRVLTTLGHQEPDRVPLFLLPTMHGARELGLSIKEYFSRRIFSFNKTYGVTKFI